MKWLLSILVWVVCFAFSTGALSNEHNLSFKVETRRNGCVFFIFTDLNLAFSIQKDSSSVSEGTDGEVVYKVTFFNYFFEGKIERFLGEMSIISDVGPDTNRRFLDCLGNLGQGDPVILLNPQFLLLFSQFLRAFGKDSDDETKKETAFYNAMLMYRFCNQPWIPNAVQKFEVTPGSSNGLFSLSAIGNEDISSFELNTGSEHWNNIQFKQFIPAIVIDEWVPEGSLPNSRALCTAPKAQRPRHCLNEYRNSTAVALFLTVLFAALLGYYGTF